jgi:hypothetical protein
MTDQEPLATALAQIAASLQALQALQSQQPPLQAPAPPRPPVLELFDASSPLDLSSRAGNAAYTKACSGLESKWDGSIEKFPSLITGLRDRAIEAKWNAASPNGIMTFNVSSTDFNLLQEYHSIPNTTIEAARLARTDARAIQNSQAFYHCLKSTLEGDIKATLFDQIGNHPTQEDGATLFKTITEFSLASSLQLTIKTISDIQALDPADCQFKITTINTKLTHYFILASSGSRSLSEPEKLQHTLSTYAKIKQPEAWAQWTRTQIDSFDDGTLTSCQKLMNSATLKQLKISSEDGLFRGRSTTMTEDVVAMLANHKSKPAAGTPKSKPGPKSTPAASDPLPLPPFITFYKAPDSEGGAKYKVGDSKMFEGRKFHFCDAPTHRDKHKWHLHPATICRNRKSWLKNESPTSVALAADASDAVRPPPVVATPPATTAPVPTPPAPGPPAELTVLLASCLQHAGDNPLLQALIGDALNQAEADL